jgi:hypothetical protein
MNIVSTIESICQAIAVNSALTSWGTTAYAKSVYVWQNVDPRRFPKEEHCPAVAVYPHEKEAGMGIPDRIKRNIICVDCFVFDLSVAAHATITRLMIYAGLGKLEAMRLLVQAAIEAIDIGNVYIEKIQTTYNTIDEFPIFRATMEIWFAEEMTLGCDPLS